MSWDFEQHVQYVILSAVKNLRFGAKILRFAQDDNAECRGSLS